MNRSWREDCVEKVVPIKHMCTTKVILFCSNAQVLLAPQEEHVQRPLQYLFEEGGGEGPALNGDVAQQSLLVGLLQDVLFHCLLTHQPAQRRERERERRLRLGSLAPPQTAIEAAVTSSVRPEPSLVPRRIIIGKVGGAWV